MVRGLPPGAVLLELPLGHPNYDLRAMYYAIVHWRRIVNGYSGFVPPDYMRKTVWLSDIPRHRDASWNTLRETGATHVIVHEDAYLGNEGALISDWLRQSESVEIFRDRADVLFALPSVRAANDLPPTSLRHAR